MGRESDEGDRDRSILSPDDLDITRDERAAPLSDGRFVIAADADDSPTPSEDEGSDPPAATGAGADEATGAQGSALDRVGEAEPAHGFVLAAKFGGPPAETSVFADDMGQVFRALLLWYAAGVDPSTPPEEVIGVLLRAAGLAVRYPPGTLARLVATQGLTPEDDIRSLLEAVSESGVRIE